MRTALLGFLACTGLAGCGDAFTTAPADGGKGSDAPSMTDARVADSGPVGSDGGLPEVGPLPCSPDLTSDTHNCGACGHDCLGGVCSKGLCPKIPLAMNLINPREIAMGLGGLAGSVYVTVQNTCLPDCATGEVDAIPTTPGPKHAISTSPPSEDTPEGIAVNAVSASVYWADASSTGTGSIQRWRGGTETPFVPNLQSPLWLALGGGNLFWATQVGIIGMQSETGTLPTKLFTDSSGSEYAVPSGLVAAAAGDRVFWSDIHTSQGSTSASDGAIRELVVSSMMMTTLALGVHDPSGLDVTDRFVVWPQLATGGLQVYDTTNGNTANLGNLAEPIRVVIAQPYIYFTTYSASNALFPPKESLDGTVHRVLLAGGEAPVPLAKGLHSPVALALDAQYVYWVERGSPNGTDGAVYKVAR